MEKFNIPVALIFFNRPDCVKQVMEVICKVKPSKLFLISDAARAEKENEEQLVKASRDIVESMIDWECEIVKNYASENMGCYDRIANGATWVFSQVKKCIFLEDDNVPSLSFFTYCEEMLNKYENNDKIYWVCGGNYLVDYKAKNNASYMFTRQMFPCGWASWSDKWAKYDGFIKELNKNTFEEFISNYDNPKMRYYYRYIYEKIMFEIQEGKRLYTWDYQWLFRVVMDQAYAIAPSKNLIRNIGVGPQATHGSVKMTKRLKGLILLENKELEFPLVHPDKIELDKNFENLIEERLGGVPQFNYRLSRFKKILSGRYYKWK